MKYKKLHKKTEKKQTKRIKQEENIKTQQQHQKR